MSMSESIAAAAAAERAAAWEEGNGEPPPLPGRREGVTINQIFKATYSGVPVWEFICRGVAVMRRRSDSYLNATHLLKVANFDKPQRTRILEREVQKGEHEKVQGGYGKYQGTWVPFERGIQIAQQYSIEDELRLLFEFVPTAESPPLAPKHITAATHRPRKVHGMDTSGSPLKRKLHLKRPARSKAPGHTPVKAQATVQGTAETATHAEGSANASVPPVDIPPSLGVAIPSRASSRVPPSKDLKSSSASFTVEPDKAVSAHSRSDLPSTASGVGEYVGNFTGVHQPGAGSDDRFDATHSPAKKKRRRKSCEPNPPTTSGNRTVGADHSDSGGYSSALLNYFLSDSMDVPKMLLSMPLGFDVDLVIDEEGHTALHWAATLANMRVAQVLMQQGANAGCVNAASQTPLMRAVMVPNSHDKRMFGELLDLLHPTIFMQDREGQTVLHHAVRAASANSRASRYYVECLMDHILFNYDDLSSLVDIIDVHGDTALTIAARLLDRRLVKLLLKAGGDPSVRNSDGMSADDYATEFLEQGYAGSGGGRRGRIRKELLGPDTKTAPQPEYQRSGAAARVFPLLERYIGGTWEAGGGFVEKGTAHPFQEDGAAVDAVAQTARKVAATEAQVDEVTRVLCRVREEAETARQTIDALRPETELIPRLRDQVRELESDLRRTIHSNQRLKLRSLLHQLSEQVEREEQERCDGLPAEQPEERREELLSEARSLRDALATLQRDRRDLVEEMVHLRSQAGGSRQNEYRRLIARCCDVPHDEVDGMIRSLLDSVRSSQDRKGLLHDGVTCRGDAAGRGIDDESRLPLCRF